MTEISLSVWGPSAGKQMKLMVRTCSVAASVMMCSVVGSWPPRPGCPEKMGWTERIQLPQQAFRIRDLSPTSKRSFDVVHDAMSIVGAESSTDI